MPEFGVPVKDAAITQPEISTYDVQDILLGVIPESDAMLAGVRAAVAKMDFADPSECVRAEEIARRDYWRLSPDAYRNHKATVKARHVSEIPAEHMALLGRVRTNEQATFALSSLQDVSRRKMQLHDSIDRAERLEEMWAQSRHAYRSDGINRYGGNYEPFTAPPLRIHNKGVANVNGLASRMAAEAKAQLEEGTLYRTGYSRRPEVVRHRREGALARKAKKLGKSLLSLVF